MRPPCRQLAEEVTYWERTSESVDTLQGGAFVELVEGVAEVREVVFTYLLERFRFRKSGLKLAQAVCNERDLWSMTER